MRRHITAEQIDKLVTGNAIDLKLSPKRVLKLDPKTDAERKLEALHAKYEAEKAKIIGVASEVVEPKVDSNIDE